MKIYLTIEVDSKDELFNKLEGFHKVNFIDLDQKYNYNLVGDSSRNPLDNLLTEIDYLNQDLIVGFACYDLKELLEIESKIVSINKKLDKVFLPSLDKRISKLVEGQKIYSEHSRWLDWPPGYVEDLFAKFEINVTEIKEHYKNTLTIIEEV